MATKACMESDEITGYEFEANGEIPKELECVICHYLMREAVGLPCSHAFCKLCLQNWEKKRKKKNTGSQQKPYLCLVCRKAYKKGEVLPNQLVDRIITTSLEVFCKQKKMGCTWIGTISNYQDSKHLGKECLYTIAECQFYPVGCNVEFIRKDTKEHYESHKDQHMALILQQLPELKQDGHQTKEDLDQTKTETLKTIMQLSATKKELSLTIQKLKETTEDALQTKEELLKTKAQLNSTKIEFLKTQELLSLTIQKLKETTEDALQTKEELLKTKEQLNLTKIQLSITEEKLYETEFQLDRNAESEERAKETVTDEAESLGIEIEDEESAVEILSNIVKTNRAYRVNEFKRMLSITAGLRKENKRLNERMDTMKNMYFLGCVLLLVLLAVVVR